MKKYLLLFIVTLTVSSCGSKTNLSESDGIGVDPAYLPSSWYEIPEISDTNPEVAQSTTISANTLAEKNESKTNQETIAKSFGEILEAHHSALESMSTQDNRSANNSLVGDIRALSLANRPKDWVPWRLVAFVGEIAVSAQGLIGALTAKGTPAVIIQWQKRENFIATPKPQSEISENTVLLGDNLSEQEIENELEPTVQAVLSTGRVKNEKQFRSSFYAFAKNFHNTLNSVSNSDDGVWNVERFRLDLSVSESGHVGVSFGTLGFEVRVRLEWFKRPDKKFLPRSSTSLANFSRNNLSEDQRKFSGGLAKLITTLSQDLNAISTSETSPLGSSFEATSYRVGVGLSAKGDVGIGKGSAKIVGHIYYKKAPPSNGKSRSTITGKVKTTLPRVETDDSVLFITDTPNPAVLSFAKNKKIDFESANTDQNEAVFKVNRVQFRKGLEKSFKLARFFVKNAEKKDAQTKRWGISKVKAEFEMSITGDVGTTTLTGLTTSQIEFKNTKF